MGVWIRTQDKKTLLECNCIMLVEYKEFSKEGPCKLVEDFKNNTWIDLGYFATKERALEVLEQIHYFIDNHITIGESKQFDSTGWYSFKNVYQIPEEKEQ